MPGENKTGPRACQAIMDASDDRQESLLSQLISGKYEEDKRRQLQFGANQGAPCKRCGDKCEGGLEVHFWRKICKNCNCRVDDHHIELNNNAQKLMVQNLFTASDGTSTLADPLNSDNQQAIAEQQQLLARQQQQQKAMSASGSDSAYGSQQTQGRIPSSQSQSAGDDAKAQAAKEEADRLAQAHRRQQLVKQHPPHDTDPAFCHDLSDDEKAAMQRFSDNLKRNAIGQGVLKQNTDNFPWVCSGCNGNIPVGSSAVFADRAGPAERWHPACFKCSTCDEQLVDFIYFNEDGKLFCGRHYAEKFKARCAACDELIFEAQYTEAEDKAWHRRHFVCFKCEKNLAGQQYVSHQSQPFCMQCYHSKHANTCSACHTIIVATSSRITHEKRHWHATPECFSCRNCNKSLVDGEYLINGDKIYCSTNCARAVAQ